MHRVLPQENVQREYSAYNMPQNRNIAMIEELNDLDVASNVDELMTAPSSPARATYRNIFGPGNEVLYRKMFCFVNEYKFIDLSTAATPLASTAPIDLIADYNNGSSSSSGASNASQNTTAGPQSNVRHKAKDVVFNVHHKYDIYKITISNQATVGELKAKIMDVTAIPVCRQTLAGWMGTNQQCTNASILHTLNVARENELILTDLSTEGFTDDVALRRQTDTFTLKIKRQPEGIELQLNFPGQQTLIAIKTDIYTITDIPVRHQEWTGWPPNMNNNTTLAQSGIDLEHSLVLRSNSSNSNFALSTTAAASAASTTTNSSNHLSVGGNASNRSSSSNIIEIDSDDSEFEDATDTDFNADEDLFTDTIVRNRLNYLSKFWNFLIYFLIY